MYTRQALSWLQILLAERLDPGLELQQTDRAISISHRSLPGRIVFDVLEPAFTVPGFVPTFSTWDAAREGWVPPLGKALPAPGLQSFDGALIDKRGCDYHVRYDVLGLAYWMLNRIEEQGSVELDAHARFKSTRAHAVVHDYIERPVVDEWFDILRQVMRRAWPSLALARPPFRTWASHDVDRPSRYGFTTVRQLLRVMGGDLLRRRRIGDFLRAPLIRRATRRTLHPSDPWNTFQWLMSVSECEGLRSTFFFICGRTDAAFDALYEPEHPAIQALIRSILARGHEVGLHPSYNAYLSKDTIAREAKRLQDVCGRNGAPLQRWGSRMHYLRWSQPETLVALNAAGSAYDSSMTYGDRGGFRCGTCSDFPAFLPHEDRILDIRIRPLVVMESAIVGRAGLGADAYERFVGLKSACRSVGGVFSLLWHNSDLETDAAKDLYRQVLKA